MSIYKGQTINTSTLKVKYVMISKAYILPLSIMISSKMLKVKLVSNSM